MPGGRPTLYSPEYCDAVEEYGREGKSPAQIAARLNVCRQTLENWAQEHPEFLAALTRAKSFAQAWWEDEGQAALHDREFNSTVWTKTVQARFREDYTERREVSGPDGGAIPTRLEVAFVSPKD